jgi:hypothetical protein
MSNMMVSVEIQDIGLTEANIFGNKDLNYFYLLKLFE